MHLDPSPDQPGGNVGLQVREGQHKIRVQRLDLLQISTGERPHPRLFAPHAGGADGIAGDPDNPVVLAKKIQRLDSFFGETNDPVKAHVLALLARSASRQTTQPCAARVRQSRTAAPTASPTGVCSPA